LMTHRAFSRNAASSRAIPVERMIAMVEEDPAIPVRWGLNGKGMQDHGEMSANGANIARKDWLMARDAAVLRARHMLMRNEQAHKQIINRILAPFMHMTTLVSATEWANFFALRKHKDADPTFEALATMMWEAYHNSTPDLRVYGDWHLPYITSKDIDAAVLHVFKELETLDDDSQTFVSVDDMDTRATAICCRLSAARCARVSYLNHDKTAPSIEEDLALFSRLIERNPMHASPVEHQATPDRIVRTSYGFGAWEHPERHGNFQGWQQYRKMFVGETVTTIPAAVAQTSYAEASVV
jgi:hypothetical protein